MLFRVLFSTAVLLFVGVLWESLSARHQLMTELEHVRLLVNEAVRGYEGWKCIARCIASTAGVTQLTLDQSSIYDQCNMIVVSTRVRGRSGHSTGLKSEDKVWVVVNKGILLTEADGILFAPKDFKEHVDIASNTGIVSVSFLSMTNLIPSAVEGSEEERDTTRRGERLLFFPCLFYSDRPDEMTSKVYQFGWCLQCTGEHDYFPPRYFHVLSLHLAYKMALPQDEKLNCRCTFWRNGCCTHEVQVNKCEDDDKTHEFNSEVKVSDIFKERIDIRATELHNEGEKAKRDDKVDMGTCEVSESGSELLDIKDLADIIEELKAQHFDYTKWFELGLYLGLYYEPTLKAIEDYRRGNPIKCLIECLSAWLRKEDGVKDKGCPSWLALVTALGKLKEEYIAARIVAKYCK